MAPMTNLEVELTALRQRSHRAATYAWMRSLRALNRRAIREPADRDAYRAAVGRRLAAIEHEARVLYAGPRVDEDRGFLPDTLPGS